MMMEKAAGQERGALSRERGGGQAVNAQDRRYAAAAMPMLAAGGIPPRSGMNVLQLQRTIGNRAVGAMLERWTSSNPGKPAAPRTGSAVIRRMIDSDVPVATNWETLEKYVYRTLINPRKQTFEQSVLEYIETKAAGHGQISTLWEQVKAGLQSKADIGDVTSKLTDIRTGINTVKATEPDHPNKRGIGPSQELYETIPQSETSKTVAATIRLALLNDFTANVQYKIIKPRIGPAKMVPDKYGGNPIVGKWSESFMMGVLVLPNDEIHVSHSGFMGQTQHQVFEQIVQDNGGIPVTHDTTTKHDQLTQTFTDILQREMPKHPHHQIVQDNGRDKVQHDHPTHGTVVETGNPVGTCAAPQAVHPFNDPRLPDFPANLTGDTAMGMTEVLVRYESKIKVKMSRGKDKKYMGNTNPVKVLDMNDAPQLYSGGQDVVSCLTCQFQLRETLKRIVDRRRNVLNKETIENLEKASGRYGLLETAEQLIADLGDSDKLDALVHAIEPGTGKNDLGDVSSETAELREAVTAYKEAIGSLAKQQTEQPEHIEWDRGTEPERAATDFKALTGKEKKVRQEQGKIALGRHKLVGKSIDIDKYVEAAERRSKEVEKASQSARSKKHAAPAITDPVAEVERAERALEELRELRILGIGNAESLAAQIAERLDLYIEAGRKLSGLAPEKTTEAEQQNATIDEIAKELQRLVRQVPSKEEAYAALREEKSLQAADEAKQSSLSRYAESNTNTREAERQEAMLRRGAEIDANQARERRENKALKEAEKLESLAGDIARMYDMSLSAAIVYLASRLQAVPDDSPNPMEDAYL
ncbi:hypothetical protein [Paenibacillus sp. GCM10012303]|uniref:hypothetical protein n=1 Tax=Paenibacillus sp. GCM10012303 TaxID=3317340 RepID=UPI00361B46E7